MAVPDENRGHGEEGGGAAPAARLAQSARRVCFDPGRAQTFPEPGESGESGKERHAVAPRFPSDATCLTFRCGRYDRFAPLRRR